MRALDPTISDFSKGLSQGKSPKDMAHARIERDYLLPALQRLDDARVKAWKADAQDAGNWAFAQFDYTLEVQVEPLEPRHRPHPKPKKVTQTPQLQAMTERLKRHFCG